jgi:hypothetical protein
LKKIEKFDSIEKINYSGEGALPGKSFGGQANIAKLS